MKIDLTELLRQVGNEADIEQSEQVSFAPDGLNLTRPVEIYAHLVNAGESVLLYGRAETEVELECSRCLKGFRRPLRIELDEEFTRAPLPVKGGGEVELKAEDFNSPIGRDNSIDLTELIRQELLLALPIQQLCSENCPGLPEVIIDKGEK